MASVANDDPNVMLSTELQSLRNMGWLANIHGVSNVVSDSARLGDWVERIARAIGKVRRHD